MIEAVDATEADLQGIADIYNEVIAHSTAVFSDAPVTLEDRRLWIAARRAAGYPVLVIREGSKVLGFGSFGEFRGAWRGYHFTVEHSVHVGEECRGKGIGSVLVRALIQRAVAMEKHAMIGAIDAENEVSLKLHERLGFQRVGLLPEVGFKFGRWLDLVLVQRLL